ncbi:hypothetical protein VOLCADRAFT_103436 [Volvox carteri f. nagariensis]|uniref:Uncharacterized protein n=1 Tax=Volvox carteri f. nagariensis TaxID=3068 RepID=D8TLU6_VOLCA|nr:uncharacterized protein VOLCADRAFT_103436 [Volvox carteri f. nagariensis]EFJ51393.1 hypothetical protein VOLCADRAFT_103436 [Volvox carteri f. nagariensis]|eukprot:XP_002947345.1 hypothetical protein VOLCADRAFT_103436 [Volvox carteri f. nagariensis]
MAIPHRSRCVRACALKRGVRNGTGCLLSTVQLGTHSGLRRGWAREVGLMSLFGADKEAILAAAAGAGPKMQHRTEGTRGMVPNVISYFTADVILVPNPRRKGEWDIGGFCSGRNHPPPWTRRRK